MQYGNEWISYPYDGQSICINPVYFDEWEDYNFFPVKENNPTIGYNPFSVNSYGTINGYVYDIYENPVNNAILNYLGVNQNLFQSDENGFFQRNNIHGRNYLLKLLIDDTLFGEQFITVEPDSTTTVNFYTTYIPQAANENKLSTPNKILSNYPNPFNPFTTIKFNASNAHNAKIEIFNSKGQKIETYNFNGALLQSENSFTWNATNQSSGTYFYRLEIDGKVIKNKKMLLLK